MFKMHDVTTCLITPKLLTPKLRTKPFSTNVAVVRHAMYFTCAIIMFGIMFGSMFSGFVYGQVVPATTNFPTDANIRANNPADFVIVIVDSSDSMGRRMPQAKGFSKPSILLATQAAIETNLLNRHIFPEFTWLGVQYLGGRRDAATRSCLMGDGNGIDKVQLATNRINGSVTGNVCMLSTWGVKGGKGTPDAPISQGSNSIFVTDILNALTSQDYTNFGESLRYILDEQYQFFGSNNHRTFRVLLVTDGGESCHRQYTADPSSASENSPLSYIRNHLIDPRLSLYLVLVSPISSQDIARMQQWVTISNSVLPKKAGPSRISVVGTEEDLERAMIDFRRTHINRGNNNNVAEPANISSMTGILPDILHFNPCQACGENNVTPARRCQCCLLSYQTRDCSETCCSKCLVEKFGDQSYNDTDLVICTKTADCDSANCLPFAPATHCSGAVPANIDCYQQYRAPKDSVGTPPPPAWAMSDYFIKLDPRFIDRQLYTRCTNDLPFPFCNAFADCAADGSSNVYSPNICPLALRTRCKSTSEFSGICRTAAACVNPVDTPPHDECCDGTPTIACNTACTNCCTIPGVVRDPECHTNSMACPAAPTRKFEQCCTEWKVIRCGEPGHPGTCACDTSNCHPCRQTCDQEAIGQVGLYPTGACNMTKEQFCYNIGQCRKDEPMDYAFPQSVGAGVIKAGCGLPLSDYDLCSGNNPLSSTVGYVRRPQCYQTVP